MIRVANLEIQYDNYYYYLINKRFMNQLSILLPSICNHILQERKKRICVFLDLERNIFLLYFRISSFAKKKKNLSLSHIWSIEILFFHFCDNTHISKRSVFNYSNSRSFAPRIIPCKLNTCRGKTRVSQQVVTQS